MAVKVWLLTLPDSYRGPLQDQVDTIIVKADGAPAAKTLADAAYPQMGGAWTDHSTSQDCSVTPAADAGVVGIRRSTVEPIAIAV